MHSLLEHYVETLGQELKALSLRERLEQLDETQAHLEGLTLAYQELGQSEVEAQTNAIAQFGAVEHVAQELNRACRKQRSRQVVGAAAIYLGLQQLCGYPLSVVYSLLYHPQRVESGSAVWGITWIPVILVAGMSVLASLWAGALLRRLVPGGTRNPILLAAALTTLLAIVWDLRLWFQLGSPFFSAIWTVTSLCGLLTSGALHEGRAGWRRQGKVAVR